MTDDPAELEKLQSLEGARRVLVALGSNQEIRASHEVIAPFLDDTTLGRIVELAWRYQFSDDRYGFKRDIRELGEYVALKAKERGLGE